jgi:hypothetical protein
MSKPPFLSVAQEAVGKVAESDGDMRKGLLNPSPPLEQ